MDAFGTKFLFSQARSAMHGAAIVAAVCTLSGCPFAPTPSVNPNVILISLDTLRADHLGCYGYKRATSPFLDELANTSVLFENAFVQVPGTLPSHMSMLTGLHPREHGVFPPDGILSPAIQSLPEILTEGGVRTGGFTEGGFVAGRFGFSRGFESFSDSAKKISTDIEDTFQSGLDFIATVPPGSPFFLFLHTYATHDPYFPPPPYCTMFLPEVDQSPAAEFSRISAGNSLQGDDPNQGERQRIKYIAARDFVENHLPPGLPMPTGPNLAAFHNRQPEGATIAAPYYRALYDGGISYVDDVIKSFFHRLEDMGVAHSTIVITSDHGEEFFEHGRFAHSQVYNECLHVPLIITGPRVSEARRISEIVTSLDLTPTILDLFGMSAPPYLSGESLVHTFATSDGYPAVRDAHAVGVAENTEALYRRTNSEIHQLVVNTWDIPEKGLWVSDEIAVQTLEDSLTLEMKSYFEPRTVTIRIDNKPAGSLPLVPIWGRFEIELGGDGLKHTVALKGLSCDSPADLEKSPDRRCLSFQVGTVPARSIEYFNLTRDPLAEQDLSDSSSELLRALLAALEDYDKDPVAPTQNVPLDQETEQRLRSLGYLQ